MQADNAAAQWQQTAVVLKSVGLFGIVNYSVVPATMLPDAGDEVVWEVAPDGYAPRHIAYYFNDEPVYFDEKQAHAMFPHDAPPRPGPSPAEEQTKVDRLIENAAPGVANVAESAPAPELQKQVWVSDSGSITLTLDDSGATVCGEYVNIFKDSKGKTQSLSGKILSGDDNGDDVRRILFADIDELSHSKVSHQAFISVTDSGIRWESDVHTPAMPDNYTFHRQPR